MENGGEGLIFRTKLDKIIGTLKILKEKGVIDDRIYCDFMLLTLSALTISQLEQIDHDLSEIFEGENPYRGGG
jgi:hypothetical protein